MLQAMISLRFHCPALGLLHQHGSITQEIPLTQKNMSSVVREMMHFLKMHFARQILKIAKWKKR